MTVEGGSLRHALDSIMEASDSLSDSNDVTLDSKAIFDSNLESAIVSSKEEAEGNLFNLS